MLSTSAIVIVGALSIFTLKSEPIEINKTKVLEIEKQHEPKPSNQSEILVPLENHEVQISTDANEAQVQLDNIQRSNSEDVFKQKQTIEQKVIVEKKQNLLVKSSEIRIDEPEDSDALVLDKIRFETEKTDKNIKDSSQKARTETKKEFIIKIFGLDIRFPYKNKEKYSPQLQHKTYVSKDTSDSKHAALTYDRIDYFGEKREYWAQVKNDGKFGFIDTSGIEVVPPIYNRIDHFGEKRDNWAQVKNKGKFGFIDVNGKEVVALKYDRIDFFGLSLEHWAQVKNKGLFGFIDVNGNEVVAPMYHRIDLFGQSHDNWALVKYKGKYGFIDSKGQEVVPLKYDRIDHFGEYKEGWSLVKKSGKYGFIDTEGNEIVAAIYDDISYFGLVRKGWMKVKINGKELFIDENGKEINNTSSTQE